MKGAEWLHVVKPEGRLGAGAKRSRGGLNRDCQMLPRSSFKQLAAQATATTEPATSQMAMLIQEWRATVAVATLDVCQRLDSQS